MLLRKRKPTDSVLADKKSAVAITCAILFPVLVGMVLVLLRVGMLYYYSELLQMSVDSAATTISLVSSVGGNGMKNIFDTVIYPSIATCAAQNIMGPYVSPSGFTNSPAGVALEGVDAYNRFHIRYTVTTNTFGGNLPILGVGSLSATAVVPSFLDPNVNAQALAGNWYTTSWCY